MKIECLIFDFDGLIIDTEFFSYKVWCEIFEEYGCNLPLKIYNKRIGLGELFNPVEYLERKLNLSINRNSMWENHQGRLKKRLKDVELLPGIKHYVEGAQKKKMKLAIASNSYESWVAYYLKKLKIYDYFNCIKCRDHVAVRKPDAEIYISILKDFKISNLQAIAFEDSINGINSAKNAGIFCVAIPNALNKDSTNLLNAQLKISSLQEISLNELICLVNDHNKSFFQVQNRDIVYSKIQ